MLKSHIPQLVDSLSFIWNKYEQKGYVTLYAEDQPHQGTFQTHFHGFEEHPTVHYMRPFWLAAADQYIKQDMRYCLGPLPQHHYLLNYISEFFKKYPTDVPKFAFGFLGEALVDTANRRHVDADIQTFLKSIKESRIFANTLIILVGDHGASYGNRRETWEGKLEERLPYLSLSFPQSFLSKHPEVLRNLRQNQDQLTTSLDLYETLKHLLDIKTQVSFFLWDFNIVTLS